MEGKQSLAENELRQMRSNMRDYEVLVDDYRTQVCFCHLLSVGLSLSRIIHIQES